MTTLDTVLRNPTREELLHVLGDAIVRANTGALVRRLPISPWTLGDDADRVLASDHGYQFRLGGGLQAGKPTSVLECVWFILADVRHVRIASARLTPRKFNNALAIRNVHGDPGSMAAECVVYPQAMRDVRGYLDLLRYALPMSHHIDVGPFYGKPVVRQQAYLLYCEVAYCPIAVYTWGVLRDLAEDHGEAQIYAACDHAVKALSTLNEGVN